MAARKKNAQPYTASARAQSKAAQEEEDMAIPRVTAKQRYAKLETLRDPYLTRAEACAALTIPALMPPRGSTGTTDLPTPYQSVGARGVNNLAAKLLLVLFPPGSSFFRLALDDFVLDQLAAKAAEMGVQVDEAKAQFEEAFSKVERAVSTRLEQKSTRVRQFEAFRHIITAGNGLIQVLDDSRLKFHRLNKYVVKRDQEGEVIDLVLKECVYKESLTGPARLLADTAEDYDSATDADTERDDVDVYTRVYRDKKLWRVFQEIHGAIVPGSEGTYPLDRCPWLPLRYTAVDGEDYGRSFVEEYRGDLESLDSLAQSIITGSAAAAKVIFFVDEGGITSKQELEEAPNTAILTGQAKDVTVLQLEKFADFQVASATASAIEKRLEQAFLLLSGVQRDAERVTAEEFRLLAQELESGLGGLYSLQAQDFQRPLALVVMHQMQKQNKLPHLPKEAVSPQIVTGIEGLGRNSDLAKIEALIAGLGQEFGQEAIAEWFNIGDVIKQKAAALGINVNGMVRSQDEVDQARQAQAQREAVNTLGPHVIKGMSDQAAANAQQSPQQQ